jgi:amino acid transporter
MLIEGKRPRELHWYHAGPMLFGDWGTSRLYVLSLAFFYTRHASLWFMLAMSFLLIGVGWAYHIICRIYPDGGGVYSSARHRSQTLSVIGALLLCADYLVTAAISSLDAFHYLDLPRPEFWAAGSIVLIGGINYFGPRKAGTLALIIALLTVGFTLVLAAAAFPSLRGAHVAPLVGSPGGWWAQFTSLILAISGVEAIANMTGIMVRPVAKTATRSIWPVLIEIVVLNLVLTLAMLAVPLHVLGDGNPDLAYTAHRDDMLRVIAEHYIGPGFAAVASLVFAFLLLSATNTALTGLVSIQFMMARDRELPAFLGLLNAWGMPLVPLFLATVLPVAVLMAAPDIGLLAELYAIGVVGAVAINLGTCSTNFSIPLKWWERWPMSALAVLMVAIWFTVAYEKPHAFFFAMSVLGAGLTGRFCVRNRERIWKWMLEPVPHPWMIPVTPAGTTVAAVPTVDETAIAPHDRRPPTRRIMVATHGNLNLSRFALEEAKARQAELLVLFVRHIAVPTMGPSNIADASEDSEAQNIFRQVTSEAHKEGV